MAEPWIRVHATLIDKPVVDRAVDVLGIDEHAAVGLLVTFWGAVSQHVIGGHVGERTDRQLETWARWKGKRGRFAAFIREQHLDAEGRVNEWDEYAGALEVRRAKERDRKAKERERRHGSKGDAVTRTSRGHPADTPRDVTRSVRPARANETKRDETRRSTDLGSESSKKRSGELDPESGVQERGENSARDEPGSAPLVADLPEPIAAFLSEYYGRGTASPERRRDVWRQVQQLLEQHGAARVAAKCRQVMASHVRTADRAIVVLLKKIEDTTEVTEAAARTEAQVVAREEAEGRTRLARAFDWLASEKQILREIDEQLGDEPTPDNPTDPLQRVDLITWRYTRAQLVLKAWQDAGEPAPINSG